MEDAMDDKGAIRSNVTVSRHAKRLVYEELLRVPHRARAGRLLDLAEHGVLFERMLMQSHSDLQQIATTQATYAYSPRSPVAPAGTLESAIAAVPPEGSVAGEMEEGSTCLSDDDFRVLFGARMGTTDSQ